MTERAPDAKFPKGLEPRPVLGGIIEVGAVDDIGKAFLFRDFLQGAEKEMFAEIAAVRRIFCKSFNAELVHFHHFLPDAFLLQYAMASATSLSGTDARFMVTAMALSPSTFRAHA